MIFEPQQLTLGRDPNVDADTPRVRFVDSLTNPTPRWDLRHRPDNTLTVYNHATSTTTAWFTPDDTLHVQSITVEGESGIDAGTLDGLDSSQFVRADADDTVNASLAVAGALTQGGDDVLTTADEGALDAGTLGGASLADTRPAVSDDGAAVHDAAVEFNLGQYLQASASDGVVTLDSRGGNAVGSTATATGDGSQTVFTLQHDLGSTPASVDITPLTPAAVGDWHLSDVTATNVELTYTTAPADGAAVEWYVTAFGNDGSGRHRVAIQNDGTDIERAHTLNFAGGIDASVAADGTVELSSPPGVEIRDGGDATQPDTTHIDFGPNLSVSADGDGVTVEGSDTYPSVSADGTERDASPGDLNFENNLSVVNTDSGVTIHASGDASTLDGNSADQYLRSDVDAAHDATLSLTTVGAADGESVTVSAPVTMSPGTPLQHTAGSTLHHLYPRRDGLQSLSQGGNLPTDYGMALAPDAALAFVEPDNDVVAGWVNTNAETLTMVGGARFGDAGAVPENVTLDVRGEFRGRFENRADDPSNPGTGRVWVNTSALE